MTALQLPFAAVTDNPPRSSTAPLILVVDDDALVRDVLRLGLEQAGFDVDEAADGVEALERIDGRDYALVLLDGQLPRLSGRGVLELLRADPATATLPVILVTADDSLGDRVGGLSAGANDYVTKPFALAEVVARVRANLRAADAWSETLAVHERHRASLAQAFSGAARHDSLEGAATVLCGALAGQAGVVAASIVRFTADRRPLRLASCGPSRFSFERRHVERARLGPWLDHEPLAACVPFEHHDDGRVPGMLVVELDGSRDRTGGAALAGAIDCAAAISALLRPRLHAVDRQERNGRELRALLDAGAFQPYFQPIVDLRTGETVGAEALTRFDDGSNPEHRFGEAATVGLGIELELATLAAAVDQAKAMAPSAWLSLNVSPELMLSPARAEVQEILDLRDRDLVLELSERESVTDYDAVRASLQSAGDGIRWSIDDAGSGFASLRHILRLQPAYIKLDRSWVDGVERDAARKAMIAGLRHFASETGAELIAEGIERAEEVDALVDLGVSLGQGFLLGRPAPVAAA